MAKKILKKAIDLLDLPGDVVAGVPLIEIIGSNKLRIENHKGILSYADELIEVGGDKYVIGINGRGLEVRVMNTQSLVITGEIFGIELKR